MSRKTGRDILAEKKCSPFADQVDRYLRDLELAQALRAAIEDDDETAFRALGIRCRLSIDESGASKSNMIAELADLEKHLWERAAWLSKREVPELKAMELTGPDGGALHITMTQKQREL